MPLKSRVGSFWRGLFGRRRLEADLDDELRAAQDELTARYRRGGLDTDAARRAARLELGGVEQVKEEVRRAWFGHAVDTFWRDVVSAWRGLLRTPAFTLAAILTLALGVGANSAIFSLVNAVLLQPLPFREAERLMFVWSDMTHAGYPRAPLSGPELQDLRDRATLFTQFGAIWATTAALTGDGDPEQLRIGLVSVNYFDTLGVSPAIGRGFSDEDESAGAPTAILLSASVWQRRYGSDPSIVGRQILVNDTPMKVVGVMPIGFRLLMPPDSNVPDDLQAWLLFDSNFTRNLRGQMYLRVVGRIRDGVPVDDASREVAAIGAAIGKEFPDYGSAGRAFSGVPLHRDAVRDVRPALLALSGGVFILLLIACVNVAGLLVARSAARAKETALRLALGASRLRLFSHCLAEGLVLAVLGALVGLATARAGLRVLLSLRPESLARMEVAGLDGQVLAFTTIVAVVLGLLLSLAPLAEAYRTSLSGTLREGGRTEAGAVHYRLRAGLVVVQLALGVILLVSAGLLVRTSERLQQLDPGFDANGRMTFRLALPGSRYPNLDAINAFGRTFQQQLAAVPGVSSVGAVSHLPFDNLPNWSTNYLTFEGEDESRARRADSRAVTPGYFETVGAHLVAGRYFTEDDDHNSRLVAIVDESLAKRAWPGESAIGRRLAVDPRVTGHPTVWVEVVGVVRHLRHLVLMEELREQVYFPVRQVPRTPMAYVLRTSASPASVTASVREVLARLDAQLPIFDVHPLEANVSGARATQHFTMGLAAAFAVVALALACVGIYGVIAYGVTRRRHEFGVRLALGARPGAVVGLVLWEGSRLAVLGLTLGVVLSLATSDVLRAQLFGVSPWDPVSYLVAVPVLALAVLAACWLPARRVTAIGPLEALRTQ